MNRRLFVLLYIKSLAERLEVLCFGSVGGGNGAFEIQNNILTLSCYAGF